MPTHVSAAPSDAAMSPTEGTTPRRISRSRSRCRPRFKSYADGADRAAQPLGSLLVSQALQIAKHDRGAIAFRQASHFGMEHLEFLVADQGALDARACVNRFLNDVAAR